MFASIIALLFLLNFSHAQQWSTDKANAWYKNLGFLPIGSNYIPAYAINQLEHWQADTFNDTRIDLELSWAQSLGMKTMRVFLHDLAYLQDPDGFKKRIDTFLGICANKGIKPFFVIFDSCWNAHPKVGSQPQPTPGVHNSGWVQSPGPDVIGDPSQFPRLKTYITDVIGTFANDSRILFWDMWNEPDNGANVTNVDNLMPQVFAWARSVNPTQPLTSGVWHYNGNLMSTEQIQISNSDIITFHNYDKPDSFESEINRLKQYNRPIICSEYMARPQGSQFTSILPVAKNYSVGAVNWGFVNGKTQTNFPWDSWQHPYVKYPNWVWFHDILHSDGTPYQREEYNMIRHINGCPFGYQSNVDNWKCYRGDSNKFAWKDAQAFCQQQDFSNLASVVNNFENTDLIGYLSTNFKSCSQFYIGLYNSKYYTSSDNFTWANYDTSTFRNWKSGYPTKNSDDNCVVLNTNDGTWMNQPCSSTACFVCSY